MVCAALASWWTIVCAVPAIGGAPASRQSLRAFSNVPMPSEPAGPEPAAAATEPSGPRNPPASSGRRHTAEAR